jgi:hypothetical protein
MLTCDSPRGATAHIQSSVRDTMQETRKERLEPATLPVLVLSRSKLLPVCRKVIRNNGDRH